MMFERIISDPAILAGKPCVCGTRISVEHILELLASGACQADVLRAHPQLTSADLEEAIRYAARFLRNEVVTHVRLAG